MTHISASQQRRKVQLNFATASRTSGNCVIKMVSRFLFDAFRVDYFRVGHVSTDDSIKGWNKLILSISLSFVLQKVGVWKSYIFWQTLHMTSFFQMNPKWWANDLPSCLTPMLIFFFFSAHLKSYWRSKLRQKGFHVIVAWKLEISMHYNYFHRETFYFELF